MASLAYAHVARWEEVALPDTVRSFEDLEQRLPVLAERQGLDSSEPFAFRIEADVSWLSWFVVGGMGNLAPDPRESFLRARHLGGLDDRRIEAMGIHSERHRGVLTSPASAVYMHFRTIDDGMSFVGHVDDDIAIEPGATLYLPAR